MPAYTASMRVNYSPPQLDRLLKMAGMSSTVVIEFPKETWPMYRAPIFFGIYSKKDGWEPEPGQKFRIDAAHFGLIPYWKENRAAAFATKNTHNARSETVATLASYRRPWHRCQFALIPMDNFTEPYFGPDRESKRSVRWEIFRKDRDPFTVAAIWEQWIDPETREAVLSFSTLTINSTNHPIMGQFHRHNEEARSQVIIPPELRDEWVRLKNPEDARRFLIEMPVDEFDSGLAPKGGRTLLPRQISSTLDEPSESDEYVKPAEPDLFGDTAPPSAKPPKKDRTATKDKPTEPPKPTSGDLFG